MLKSKKRGLRSGFTTGACAAAAARAATRALYLQDNVSKIAITLPNRQHQQFAIADCQFKKNSYARCTVIKDAGDDPDCTHLAKIVGEVRPIKNAIKQDANDKGIEIVGGTGVARVTKPGLGLEVDSWAINPVPKKNILEMVAEERALHKKDLGGTISNQALLVTISVPDGLALAKKTINDRLGLVGGISILGTTGIVRPYSTSAFKFSILQAIDIASQAPLTDHRDSSNGQKNWAGCELVFTTGGRSEEFAMKIFARLPALAFIQVGDFIGTAASYTAKKKSKIKTIHVVGMIGKLSKMAQGAMQTHQAGSRVDLEHLSQLAAELGASPAVAERMRNANTAREVLEIVTEIGLHEFPNRICDLVCKKILEFLNRKNISRPDLQIQSQMTDFQGQTIGKSPQ